MSISGTPSGYFEISSKANLNKIDDPTGKDNICFWLKDGKPEKLGDGSFGSVYRGRSASQEYVAIKLLYDNSEIRPRQLSELSRVELDSILTSLSKTYDRINQEEIIETIRRHGNSDYALWTELQSQFETYYSVVSEGANGGGNNVPVSELSSYFNSFVNNLNKLIRSSAVYRFQQERTISTELLDSSEKRNEDRVTEGVVKILGGCDNFHEILNRDEFREIKKYFEEDQSIKISDYVLVMDYYSFSLKDLLERPVIPEKTENGYEILKQLPHDLRIREALIILKGVANGLEKLHNVKISSEDFISFYHRDIKPGNIFIQPGRQNFEVVLGDLGNLPFRPQTDPISDAEDSLIRPPDYEYAPGTQHYRSPEQKYYKDVADVRVIHLPLSNIEERIKQLLKRESPVDDDTSTGTNATQPIAGEHQPEGENTVNGPTTPEPSSFTNQRVVIFVQDPKFKNTLFEEEDTVIFSKDTERHNHVITHRVTLSEEDGQDEFGYIAFVLDHDAMGGVTLPDEKTQVEFYKKQSFRTDLFGIGAVAFDMITVGSSPEKFYESIRKYEGESVEVIVNRYDTLTRGELAGDNPDFIEIFRPFRSENDPFSQYPDKEIIEFILKCMLYQSEGTFYQEAEEPRKASEALRDRIEELSFKYASKNGDLPESRSILIHRPTLNIRKTGETIPFNQVIDELQGLTEWKNVVLNQPEVTVAKRLALGGYYFWRMIALVRDNTLSKRIYQIHDEREFGLNTDTELNNEIESVGNEMPLVLYQILPTFIELQIPDKDRQYQANLSLTGLSTDLLKDLQENRLELLIRSSSNAFVPNEIAGMRREIRLILPPKTEMISKGKVTCKYFFRDAPVVRRDVAENGWIAHERDLWRIASKSDNNLLEIVLQGEIDAGGTIESLIQQDVKYVDATYFSPIIPLKYYFEMIALYLQHLLFTYTPITTTERDRFNIYDLLRNFELEPGFSIRPSELTTDNKLRHIYEKYIDILIKLTLHDAENSYYREILSTIDPKEPSVKWIDKAMLDKVHDDAESIYNEIRVMLDFSGGPLTDHPDMHKIRSDAPGFKEMVDELIDNRIDIEASIKRSGQIVGALHEQMQC